MLYDVLVIGGGPAGMMAAIFAARAGAKVCLLEKNTRLGTKILASGNGRCNLTNRFINENRYHGSFSVIFSDIYGQFKLDDTISFFARAGVTLKEEDQGRLFPVTDKASTVVSALENELRATGVEVFLGVTVRDLQKSNTWSAITEEKIYQAKSVILTTGGKAAHKLGSSGDGLFWASKLGHKTVPLFAALVPMETKETYVQTIMGVKLDVKATALVDGKTVREKSGEMLFTHYGVSGPAVMALAGALAPFVGEKKTEITLNMFPNSSMVDISNWLSEELQKSPKKKLSNILDTRLPLKVARLVPELLCLDKKNASEISKKDRIKVAEYLMSFPLTITKIRPLKEAQVTAGGIPLSEVTQKLESKVTPGIFFAGEILDIDGDSGGFNLQWAWSSGVVAGISAAESIK